MAAYLEATWKWAFLALTLSACQEAAQRDLSEAGARTAREVVERYLTSSRIARTEHVADTLFSCDVVGLAERSLGLAWAQVLDVNVTGDSAKASAEVVSVAEQRESLLDPNMNTVTMGLRVDTLHWRLTKDTAGRWGVCGYSSEGVDFMWGGLDVRRTWEPAGASLEAAKALADSVRKTREIGDPD
jgi:hypothetical protein